MTKQLIVLFVLLFSTAYSQKKIEISDEKGLYSIGGVKIIPYLDGSFSICKYSIDNPYSPKAEYFIYHYDKKGNPTGSKKATLIRSTAPYDAGTIGNAYVLFDDARKIWTVINTKKGQTEVFEWNENLEIVHSVKIEDKGAVVEFTHSCVMSDGKILFYKENKENHSIGRYEYDPAAKTLKSSTLFSDFFASAGKKATIFMQPAGIIDDVEYFLFAEEKATSSKDKNEFRQTLMAYTVEGGERKVSSEDFSLPKAYKIYSISNLSSIVMGQSSSLHVVYDLYASEAAITSFRLIRINPNEELMVAYIWPDKEVSWTGQPSLYCRGDGKDFHLLFKGNTGDVLSTRFDFETSEKSDISLFKSTKLMQVRDLEIFFPDESSEHLLDKLYAEGERKFSSVTYIEDEKGIGKLFLLSYGTYYRKLEIDMFE